jgi:hypothetical protein
MDTLQHAWTFPLGFVAGLVTLRFLMQWILLLLAAIGRLPPQLGTASQRPRAAGIALAVVHPVPWLLILGLAIGLPLILSSPWRAEWLWFLAGMISAPALNGAMVYLAIRRARQRRARDAAL